jgi:5-methylcytosine-specific restriction protein A
MQQGVKPAFLFTWNPRVYPWRDLRRDVRKVAREGRMRTRWSCGRSKLIRDGDRVFILRQGTEPRGIMASGYAISDWYEGPGWRRTGVPCHYVKIELDALLDAHGGVVLPRDALPPGMYWDTQSSGVRIREQAAKELEKLWRSFLRGLR